MINIRQVRPEDAAAFLELAKTLDHETTFMMREPGERNMDVEPVRQWFEGIRKADNQMMFLAETETGQLVGLLGASGGHFRRMHDTVEIFLGVLQVYSGQGIGRRLMEASETWARSWGARRLELTVMCHNQRALALYHRMGFHVDGYHKDVMKVDGQYIAEYSMCKILGSHESIEQTTVA
jgi:RimJ/RimL family protein N-acetyltransferase